MRVLTLAVVIFSSFSLKASEIDDISLITPVSYDRATSSSQTFKSRFKVGVGDLLNINVSEEVKNKIAPYTMDLAPYFKRQGELEAYVNRITDIGKATILKDGLSDQKLIKFYGFLGNELVGEIYNRVLIKEGVTDQPRRELWQKRTLAPFNACIARAKNSQYDASHCMDALTSGLVANAGIGLVYELSRSNLNASLPENKRVAFNHDQVNFYKTCVAKTAMKPSDVKLCALNSMRNGVLKISDLKLSQSISGAASSPAAAKAIKQNVWGPFQTCSTKVGTNSNDDRLLNEQFMDCIDALIKNTGIQLVQDKIAHTPAIKNNFNASEIANLNREKVSQFSQCIDRLKQNNVRKAGMLATEKCENQITNDITYDVVLRTLGKTSEETFKQENSLVNQFSNEGKKILDQCWKDDQDAAARERCLRKTVISFTQNIAQHKLDKSIPSDLAGKKELASKSLNELDDCLQRQLPQQISTASDLTDQVKKCTNNLTRKVSQEVARSSVRLKAQEMGMPASEIDSFVQKVVDQKFMTCIGNPPTDASIENCSVQLKKDAALTLAGNKIRTSAEGKMDNAATNQLVDQLVNQDFTTCLGQKPSDEKISSCVGSLTQKATKQITLAYAKKQYKEQLNADVTPEELKTVEQSLITCTEKNVAPENVSKEMDECTKQFALSFAKTLGELKLNTLMKSVLGSDEFNKQKSSLNDILLKYNECIDSLKSLSMNDQLLEKLTTCTEGLQRRGLNFVTATVNHWMSSQDKDAAALIVKSEFARFLPCLGALMPSAPYSPNLKANVESVLKPVSMLIAQYIEYDPESAKQNLDEIIKKLTTDLKDVATNPESKKALIDSLYQNGALDQFLKSMVRGQVRDSVSKMKDDEIPKDVRDIILEKDTFDKMFGSPEGQAIKDLVMEKILKPVLLEQANMKSPLMVEGMGVIKDRVIKLMVNSPHFGEKIVRSSIQTKIDQMNVFKKFFAKILYGGNALKWDEVRKTPNGVAAEEYIREKILMPKFSGQTLSKEEEKRIAEQAESLVKTAVENYN